MRLHERGGVIGLCVGYGSLGASIGSTMHHHMRTMPGPRELQPNLEPNQQKEKSAREKERKKRVRCASMGTISNTLGLMFPLKSRTIVDPWRGQG